MKSLCLLVALAGALLITGCSSVEQRTARYSQTWDKLSEADKARVRRGDLRPGDSVKLVFIRYGAPDEVRLFIPGKNRVQSIWIWNGSPQDNSEAVEPVEQAAWTERLPDPATSYSHALMPKATANQETSLATAAKWNREAYASSEQAKQPVVQAKAKTLPVGRKVPGPFFVEQGMLVKPSPGSPSLLPVYKLELPDPETRLALN